MGRNTAYLSLGSNLGDRFGHLQQALQSLGRHPQVQVMAQSSFYETEPQDVADQPWFLNLVAAVSTSLLPLELLDVLQRVERERGRDREHEQRRGPRTLDLDILLFADLVLESERLTIPHPRMRDRRFVLEPLLEIAGDLRHPGTGRPLSSDLSKVRTQQLRLVQQTDGRKSREN